MNDTEESRAELQAMLSALLDNYSSALILVRAEDGEFRIVAGGSASRNQLGVDVERYQELIRIAPSVVSTWSQIALNGEIPPPREAS